MMVEIDGMEFDPIVPPCFRCGSKVLVSPINGHPSCSNPRCSLANGVPDPDGTPPFLAYVDETTED